MRRLSNGVALSLCLAVVLLLALCGTPEARTKLRFRSQDLKPRTAEPLPTVFIQTLQRDPSDSDAAAEQAGTSFDQETDDPEPEADMEAQREQKAQAEAEPALLVAAGLAGPELPEAGVLADDPVGEGLLRSFEEAEQQHPDASQSEASATPAQAPAAIPSSLAAKAGVPSSTPSTKASTPPTTTTASKSALSLSDSAPTPITASNANRLAAARPPLMAPDAPQAVTAIRSKSSLFSDSLPDGQEQLEAAKLAAEIGSPDAQDEDLGEMPDNFYPHQNVDPDAPHRQPFAAGDALRHLMEDPENINWYDNAYSAAYPTVLRHASEVHDAHRFRAHPSSLSAGGAPVPQTETDDNDDDESSEATKEHSEESSDAFSALKVFKFTKDHSHSSAAANNNATAPVASKLGAGLAHGVTHAQNAATVGGENLKLPSKARQMSASDKELNDLEVAIKNDEQRALAEAATKRKHGDTRKVIKALLNEPERPISDDPNGWLSEYPTLSNVVATSFLELNEGRKKATRVPASINGDLSPNNAPTFTFSSVIRDFVTRAWQDPALSDEQMPESILELSDSDSSLSNMAGFDAHAGHRFRAPGYPRLPSYGAPVPTPPYGAPVPSPSPSPSPAYGAPVPAPTHAPAPTPAPAYGAPVPAPAPHTPAYGAPVPAHSAYGGHVHSGNSSSYGGAVHGGNSSYQGKDYHRIPLDKIPTFGIPKEYMAAFRKGALVLLRGKQGPKGDKGPVGPSGSLNATVVEQIEKIKKRLKYIKTNKDRMQALERKIFPFWAAEPYACPDGWLNMGYVESEQRIFCRPPTDGSNVGNPLCNKIARFPKRYDRCTWTIHCQVNWKNYGCWPFGVARPKEYTDAKESDIPQLVVLPGEDSAADTPGHPKVIPVFNPIYPTETATDLALAQDIVGRVLAPGQMSRPSSWKGLQIPSFAGKIEAPVDPQINDVAAEIQKTLATAENKNQMA